MRKSNHYSEILHSSYKKFLIGFIEQRKAIGYKFEAQILMLLNFDDFAAKYTNASSDYLNEDLVVKWVEEDTVLLEQKRRRGLLMRQFGEYMLENGKSAYLYPKRKHKSPAKYIPYIFTHEQISSIFKCADEDSFTHPNVAGRVDTAIILRMLYGCGLRISEALNLKVSDVDLKQGLLYIKKSKFQKDRIVPMSASLHDVCLNYASMRNYEKMPEDLYFFSPKNNRRYSAQTIYNRFRDIIFCIGIPHRGKGKGPRLHDFRHTFAVHSLKQLADKGEDLYTTLPILSEYMGHSSVCATQYYLRLTAEVYPDVINMMEEKFGDIYPEVLSDE